MPLVSPQLQYSMFSDPNTDSVPFVTFGTVVDANDPQNQGRLKVVCPKFGDNMSSSVDDIPWAVYISPFAGASSMLARGPNASVSEGNVAYGLWAIPKVGAKVAVVCIDGDTRFRAWFGGTWDMFTPHTMPHGRWFHSEHPGLPEGTSAPIGPLTSKEFPIQPLYDNLIQAFGSDDSPERTSRAFDYAVSRISVEHIASSLSNVHDDLDVAADDGHIYTQGYQTSRIDPHAQTVVTQRNFDNQVTALTSPGFHSISMDDRQENCRVRVRTTCGHQIIMDDTNERIYISTAEGNNWIELDQKGNVDVYAGGKFSVHSSSEINLSAGGAINLEASSINVRGTGEVKISSGGGVSVTSGANIMLGALGNFNASSGGQMNLKAGGPGCFSAGSNVNILGGGSVLVTGGDIHLNGTAAEAAADSGATVAGFATRKPQHEPWTRTSSKNATAQEMEAYENKKEQDAENAESSDGDSSSTSAPKDPPVNMSGEEEDETQPVGTIPEFEPGSRDSNRSDGDTVIVRGTYWKV